MNWYENDDFWTTFQPILFSEERLAATPSEVDGFVALARIEPGAHVIDHACGIGRHSLELARRGFRVTAVDRTAAYLKALEEQCGDLPIEIVRRDLRDFKRKDSYDAALNTFTSFGYFEDPDDDLKVANNVAESLRDEGRFVLDVIGKEVLARGWQERYWTWLDESTLLLEERLVERDWTWVSTTWTLVHREKKKAHAFQPSQYTLRHRLYSGEELRQLLYRAGFSSVSLYGSLQATPYDRTAHRLVAVAQK